MRHKKQGRKLGRSSSHRKAMLKAMVCALINEKRIETTVSKAKETRRVAERMVTIARRGVKGSEDGKPEKAVAARRILMARLCSRKAVKMLFDDIIPSLHGRDGGYTRILKLRRRSSDGAELAILEWVGIAAPEKKRKKKAKDT